jgi:hypothetical protein
MAIIYNFFLKNCFFDQTFFYKESLLRKPFSVKPFSLEKGFIITTFYTARALQQRLYAHQDKR